MKPQKPYETMTDNRHVINKWKAKLLASPSPDEVIMITWDLSDETVIQ